MTNVFQNLTNVVCSLEFGRADDALLLNAHFDTPPNSDGVMDDRAAVAVMLEVLRAVAFSDGAALRAMHDANVAVVALFNGGEEALQMASTGFITTHPIAKRVRSVVNLDSVGQRGGEILFQSGGQLFVDAYRRAAPHPFGSSMAADIFASGVVQSDTDYRIFVKHGNVTGIDLAFYRESFAYHTALDNLDNLRDGSLQHEGANVLAYVRHVLLHDILRRAALPAVPVVYFDVFQVRRCAVAPLLQPR